MPARHDYTRQALTYDRTRAASPSILGPVLAALRAAPGPRLLDVGGGTGNYATALREDGFAPVVVDMSEAMLARARTKGLAGIRADAARLPLANGCADAVTMISMIHLVTGWREALAEASRILRPGGVLSMQAYLRENMAAHWIFDYFPSARAQIEPEHQTAAEIRAALPGARLVPMEFHDVLDGSVAALCRQPRLLLDATRLEQTSFFERLEASDPGAIAAGLGKLERDLDAGRRPEEEVAALRAVHGDGTIIAWCKE